MTTRSVAIAPPARRREDFEPFLWGRNRYARLGRVDVLAWPNASEGPRVSLDAYSAGGVARYSDPPVTLNGLTPAQAREIAAALMAAADEAEATR